MKKKKNNLYYCHNCGEYHPSQNEHDGKNYCDDCFGELFFKCVNCVGVNSRDNIYIYNDDNYCEECHDELFTRCNTCGEVIRKNSAFLSENNDYYCNDCYYEIFAECSNCSCEVETDDARYIEDDGFYCSSCYERLFIICSECDCKIRRENAYIQNGEQVCSECYTPLNEWEATEFAKHNHNDYKFGLELETSSCPNANSLEGETCFGCKEDGSIDGMEFVSPVLSGKKGFDAIHKFCELAKDNYFKVDKKCGFHLHLDMSDKTEDELKRIAYAYFLTENMWRKFVSTGRANNRFCNRIGWNCDDLIATNDMDDFIRYITTFNTSGEETCSRYCWFNMQAYFAHRTFEIRLHHGTLDENEITNWVKIHIAFCKWAMKQDFNELYKSLYGEVEQQFKVLQAIFNNETVIDYYCEKLGVEKVACDKQLELLDVA